MKPIAKTLNTPSLLVDANQQITSQVAHGAGQFRQLGWRDVVAAEIDDTGRMGVQQQVNLVGLNFGVLQVEYEPTAYCPFNHRTTSEV